MPDYDVTECCGEAILYQEYENGIYEEWEFCANCLESYSKVRNSEYND